MKKFSKILSVALLVALILSLGVANAFADTDPAGRADGQPLTDRTITLSNPSAGHTYELYQIFKGTYKSIDGKDTLGDVVWGSGVTVSADGKLGTIANNPLSGKTATEVAEGFGENPTAADARAFANNINAYLIENVTANQKTAGAAEEGVVASLTWNNLSEGYYIIKDITTFSADSEDQADLVVVQVLDNVTITAKGGTTEFDKKVRDHNDSTQAPTVYDEWGNTSDYDVGDDVPFQLTITLPANYSSYEKYSMTAKDVMGAGLTFDKNSVSVTLDGKAVAASQYQINVPGAVYDTETGAKTTFDIVFADVKALVAADNYKAKDNSKFIITYNAKLTGDNVVYGNPGNPNEAWLTYSNNPTTGQEGGTTPHKTTVTFTYKFEVDKVDQNNQPLTGAEFELYKWMKTADGEGKYGTGSWSKLTIIKNEAGTVFTFDGLDDGWYMIKETKTPAGYNSIDDIYFIVECEHGETIANDKLVVKQADKDGVAIDPDKATVGFNVTLTKTQQKDAGLIDTTVINNKGAVLPSTGGIGTTIFYVVGGVLVLAAIILLVTKKRMSE